MRTFYEMLMLMEQDSQASVERFPQDFEQVLNLMAGGPWNFTANQYSPFYGMDIDKSSGLAVFYIRAEYRGMSESGRHYKVAVRLVNSPNPPINRDGAVRFDAWKQEFVSYDPKGSGGQVGGLPSVYFELEEIRELGPDTDGRESAPSEEEENPSPEQQSIRTMISQLKKIKDDLNKDRPKWTPERMVYMRNDASAKNIRPVDLAKQVRDEIVKHEKKRSSF